MPNKKITIIGIGPGKDDLVLSDGGWTKVKLGWGHRNVTWDINKKLSGVHSFRIKGKTRDHHPFDTNIPKDFGTKVPLHVKKDQSPFVWEYSILWEDEKGKEHTFDPKISILP